LDARQRAGALLHHECDQRHALLSLGSAAVAGTIRTKQKQTKETKEGLNSGKRERTNRSVMIRD
jgi:hypothetical protein